MTELGATRRQTPSASSNLLTPTTTCRPLDIPGYVPTALVALTLADAERLCCKLNVRLGLARDAWMTLAAGAMRHAGPPERSNVL